MCTYPLFCSESTITISFQPLLQDHPKDSEFLNTPIRFYTEMEAIFGGNLATGRYALGSGEPLGQSQADSVPTKVEPPPMTNSSKQTEILPEGSKTTFVPASTVCGKRKRNFSEDEMLMLTNMSDVVNNVANALRETGAAYVEDNLYQAVMEMEGYNEDALLVAYGHLLDNKAQVGALC